MSPSAAARLALEHDTVDLLLRLSDDELRVMQRIIRRVAAAGARVYGPLRVAADARDFQAEAQAELDDLLFYQAADELRGETR